MCNQKKEKKMEDYKKYFDDLSDEMKAKVANCKTADDLLNLAKTEGIELTDEQLDAISGGFDWSFDFD